MKTITTQSAEMPERRFHVANDSKSSSTLSFTSAMTLVFITLKLCGVIHWPWLWVLAPMLLSITIKLLILTVYFGGLLALILSPAGELFGGFFSSKRSWQ